MGISNVYVHDDSNNIDILGDNRLDNTTITNNNTTINNNNYNNTTNNTTSHSGSILNTTTTIDWRRLYYPSNRYRSIYLSLYISNISIYLISPCISLSIDLQY
jgi:hypothetical protein